LLIAYHTLHPFTIARSLIQGKRNTDKAAKELTMTDQDSPGAGAILLAAYFDIDTSTLGTIVAPFLSRFPDLTGAVLWNIMKLSREEDKSITEISAITTIGLPAIAEAKKCIDVLEAVSRRKNIELARKEAVK
jgi:hypothetical protein